MIPWIHMHIMPDASIIPCCVAPYDDHFGNANKETLKDIWNSKKYRELRLKMLQGQKSSTCQRCYTLEESKMNSMRKSINYRFAKSFPLVEKTDKNGKLKQLDLKYFDVRFSNICNFKCRGCSPILSSAWYEDHEKLYNYKSDKEKTINCTTNGTNNIWQQLTELIPNIDQAYFAGGEPLMMDEHYKTLEILLEHNRHDVILSYNTNMSIIRYKHYDLINLWKQFKHVFVSMSIDDIEARGEYFRKGLNWKRLIKNLDTLRAKTPHVTFSITITVNITNIYYLPEVYTFFLKREYIKADGVIFNMLLDPDEYRIQVLPKEFKEKVSHKLQKSIIMLKHSMPRHNFSHYQQQIQNILKFLHEKDQTHLLKQFSKRTQALDAIRGESFADTYPELKTLLI